MSDDSDDDGIKDGEEVFTWGSDPNDADTDGDQLVDGSEVDEWLTSPTEADTDNDNLDDFAEVVAGTDPNNPDTDDDGLLDGEDPSPLISQLSEGNEATPTAENNNGGVTGIVERQQRWCDGNRVACIVGLGVSGPF